MLGYLYSVFSLYVLVVLLAGCSPSSQLHHLSGPTMGTQYHVSLVLPGDETSSVRVDDIGVAIDRVLHDVNHAMSTYIESSEISRFNRALPDTPTSVSASTVAVFQASLHLQRFSEGHFDPTVMPLVRLWGFGPDERSGAPDPEAIEAALAKVGIGAIELDVENGTLTKKSPVELDFSAIAKGYGVDAVAELLLQQGIKGFLVEIGGEVRVGGTKPDGSPWRVGIERPEMAGRSAQMVVDLKGLSIATSGDYRNYFEQDGVRYSHTLDPRTGYPVMSRLASVSVLAETCMQADGLATALMAMGERKAVEFAGSHGIDAYFMVREGEGFKELFTGRFRQHALH